jgi:hypothetical protein
MARPKCSIVEGRRKREAVLQRYEELVAEGMRCHDAARTVGFMHTTINRWKRDQLLQDRIEMQAEIQTMSNGSFATALEKLRAGYMVRRHGASWFLQLTDGKICLYLLDGAGNRRYNRVASFGSADVLAMDWEVFVG